MDVFFVVSGYRVTPEGALLSYDGAHLTADGARYAGTRLRTAAALAAWR